MAMGAWMAARAMTWTKAPGTMAPGMTEVEKLGMTFMTVA